ncbi:MAG: isoamylase [Spirochaetaceae bacterium]|jgi:hypothetical protein|nr:isoamylase [Spirochaetaceae bacterium]
MKTTITALLLLSVIIGRIEAIDIESSYFIDHLLSITEPGKPEIFEDGVIFTAPSAYNRVGIAFAHEGFGKVYWFKKLVYPEDESAQTDKAKKAKGPAYIDSGVAFHVFTLPPDLKEVEYRLIINGLWTTDPANPVTRIDRTSGAAYSVVSVPEVKKAAASPTAPAGSILFKYKGPPGETITVAGNFNGWDPFMYELRETSPGLYTLILPLPPGVYHYVFFHRGERIVDPTNRQRVYTKDGKAASLAVVE